MQLSYYLFVGFTLVYRVVSQIPCDEVYGTNCPEASGWEVSDCLKGLDQSLLSADCVNYVNLHDSCKNDINTHCTGKEFTGDLLVCLTEWTKSEFLSSGCVEALPKKEKKEKKLSEKDKKKADARRKTRKAAEKLARSQGSSKSASAKKSQKVSSIEDDYDDDL